MRAVRRHHAAPLGGLDRRREVRLFDARIQLLSCCLDPTLPLRQADALTMNVHLGRREPGHRPRAATKAQCGRTSL